MPIEFFLQFILFQQKMINKVLKSYAYTYMHTAQEK